MDFPEKHSDSKVAATETNRGNQRRLVILVAVIFLIVISFFIGRNSGPRTYVNPAAASSSGQTPDPSGRSGIPPDSLPH